MSLFQIFCAVAHSLSRYRQRPRRFRSAGRKRPRKKRLSAIWRDWPPWVFLCPTPGSKNGATQAEASRLYDHDPSFVDLLPWAEYLPDEQVMLLEDGRSRAAFFELVPLGTEGHDPNWMQNARTH